MSLPEISSKSEQNGKIGSTKGKSSRGSPRFRGISRRADKLLYRRIRSYGTWCGELRSYFENKAKCIVVTDINDAKIARAKEVIPEEEAGEKGAELLYVNTANMEDPIAELHASHRKIGGRTDQPGGYGDSCGRYRFNRRYDI